ncbi:MAG: glucan biosynthesis protein [Alphaproteobacteria bacterium]|nr:glucan biosynthesis protein [Alphaproteobacteria bacterium]MCW5741513.1 glucan biosynthesis protein [Alphaproteobacteria bacterium]
MAAEPYKAPPPLPPSDLARINYDQYMRVQFRPEAILWRSAPSMFRAEFFPAGFIYNTPVAIHVVAEDSVAPLTPSPGMFDFGPANLREPPGAVAFAGFRLTYPLHEAKFDEIISFLGASYFRPIGREQTYGASARGLAIDTGLQRPEEFPAFRAFWLVAPAKGARELTLHALLDSPGATGAYTFLVRPGRRTTIDVSATLFARHDISLLGIAPLTSMFFAGKTGRRHPPDHRPEIHDSDGLLIASGSGERIWRPLSNPSALAVSSFKDRNPRGFGLLQRERGYAQYKDLEARYHARPSLWVEPAGEWGEGEIRLVEIPTDSEVHDNIAAFWASHTPTRRGQEVELRYRVSALSDEQALSPGGFVTGVRVFRAPDPKFWRLAVEFGGGDIAGLRPAQPVEAEIAVSSGRLAHARTEPIPDEASWRLFVDVQPDGKKPMEVRAHLRLHGEVLSETMTYTVRP